MRTYSVLCDACRKEIPDNMVWRLEQPPTYKGISYDLCFDCVDRILEFLEIHKKDLRQSLVDSFVTQKSGAKEESWL